MIESLFNTIKENQTLLAALGLGSAGIITFWLKDVPKLIFKFLKRELTTSLTVTNQNITFYNILKWVSVKYKNKNFRFLKLTNGKWGEDKETTLSIGYGVHFVWYKGRLWLVQLVKEEGNQTFHDKEYIEITKFGRSKKLFDAFLQEVKECEDDTKTVKIYRYNDSWEYVKTQNKRSLDTVFIEKQKKEELVKRINSFITNEDWYLNNGVPYQLGILLYGPPGTGKTSLIRAISSYLNYPIYNIQTSKLLKIDDALEALSEKCIVVIEDIDCQKATNARETSNNEASLFAGKNGDLFSPIGLAEILNALDGVCTTDGRVLIATTNYIEKLDSALIRPGRFDLKLKIDYLSNETFVMFMERFFPETNVSLIQVKNEITISTLQEFLFSGASAESIINFVKAN